MVPTMPTHSVERRSAHTYKNESAQSVLFFVYSKYLDTHIEKKTEIIVWCVRGVCGTFTSNGAVVMRWCGIRVYIVP